jgi:glycosyltransferase involved in cell wall biosynthesis
MKVLCIAETLGRGGGAEQLIYALAPHFRAIGMEVHYLALFPYEDDLGVVMQAQGHQVFRAQIDHPWRLWDGCQRIRRQVNLDDYDLVWGHLYFGNLYASLLNFGQGRRKTIISLHSEGYAQQVGMGLKTRVITAIESLFCGRAQGKYAVSMAVKQDYERFFGWGDLGIIHNGVDVAEICPEISDADKVAVRQAHGVDQDDFFIVVPARFVKKKGHTFLIRAVRALLDEGISVKAFFASAQGPERGKLEAEIAQLGLASNIRLSDATVPHERLLQIIKSSDAVVIPSLREPFGIAAAEAMACRTPAVLTKVDGFKELIGSSAAALMVEPGDAEQLTDAIRMLVGDPDARARLAERGFARVRDEFDIRTCAENWARAFGQVLGQGLTR